MTKFADIGKAPKDLLSDDYTTSVSLKCKKNAGPIAVTIDTDRAASGALTSKIGTKATFMDVFFDVKNKPCGAQTLESSISPCPGCKVTFKGGKGADLDIDYATGKIITNTTIDVKEMSKISSALSLSVAPGIVAGGSATYGLKGKGLTSYGIAASYSKGPLFTSVESAGNVSSVNVGVLYKVNDTLSVASSSSHSSAKPLDAITVGGIYKAPVGDIKAKFGNDGSISACLIKEIAPKVTLTASGTTTTSDLSNFKYGLGIVM
jgi:voltage-dependent anion channel protein 2